MEPGGLEKEVREIKELQKEILLRLDRQSKGEQRLEGYERRIIRDLEHTNDVSHFSLADLGQAVVGAVVFGGPAFFSRDFWIFLSGVAAESVLFLHLIVVLAVVVTLYHAYRKTLSYDAHFTKALVKRVFYVYLTVFAVVVTLLALFGKLSAAMTTADVMTDVLAVQTVALVGAVTFDFLVD
ncbi:hypothetical protein JXB02_00480 [Candidatus Woesearchaeota archaeon]|nr:hypothetical protein [Candidatus Woesearchaeota archaeon]